MKLNIFPQKTKGKYTDPTSWQNTTLRYAPPRDFPAYLAQQIGRAQIMRVFITLDEYWELTEDKYYPNYEIGKARIPLSMRHFPSDWECAVPAPSGTRFEDYIRSHAENADALLLNVRRLEREVSDGIISYEKYAEVFSAAVAYCKELAPNIRYIECCNEVDCAYFGNLTAEEYVKLYLVAYKAVKDLNKAHHYDIPLEIGGYSAAFPINRWEMFSNVMHLLKKSEIGDRPMDFYSYHHYEAANMAEMLEDNCFELAETSDLDKLKHILTTHNMLVNELGLSEAPVFLNEIGRAKCTGIPSDSLYNAAGLLTYLIAAVYGEFKNTFLFPWCTFHTPKQQISYTQFLLQTDGTYAATPNGIALLMLHRMHGDIIEVYTENAIGRDTKYRVVATKNAQGIQLLCVNPTNDIIPCKVVLNGLVDGRYPLDIYQCSDKDNNCVTGNGSGSLKITNTINAESKDGKLEIMLTLDRDNFVLCEIPTL